jgi:hypothetical protein
MDYEQRSGALANQGGMSARLADVHLEEIRLPPALLV